MSLWAVVYHAAKGSYNSLTTMDGKHTLVLQGGQIVYLKGSIQATDGTYGQFSAYDLGNHVPDDNYPDFCVKYNGDGTWGESGEKMYYLYDFNQRVYGSKWERDGGSMYDVDGEMIQIYDWNNNFINQVSTSQRIVFGSNEGYMHSDSDLCHTRCHCSGYVDSSGVFHSFSGYADLDPSQPPSESGINTF